MSAYIVEDETMETIITAIYKEWDIHRRSIAFRLFCGTTRDELGTLFFKLNTEAVNHRYNKNDEPEPYKHNDRHASAVEGLDAIRSLVYQCSEGRVMESDDGKLLEKAAELLALEVAEIELEKFREAKWKR